MEGFLREGVEVVLPVGPEDIAGDHGVVVNPLDGYPILHQHKRVVLDILAGLADRRRFEDRLQFFENQTLVERLRRMVMLSRNGIVLPEESPSRRRSFVARADRNVPCLPFPDAKGESHEFGLQGIGRRRFRVKDHQRGIAQFLAQAVERLLRGDGGVGVLVCRDVGGRGVSIGNGFGFHGW